MSDDRERRLDIVLAAYADDALEPEDRAKVTRLLADRPTLCDRVDGLCELQDQVRIALRHLDDPGGLDDAHRRQLRTQVRHLGRQRRRERWLRLGVAAAAVLVIGVLVGVVAPVRMATRAQMAHSRPIARGTPADEVRVVKMEAVDAAPMTGATIAGESGPGVGDADRGRQIARGPDMADETIDADIAVTNRVITELDLPVEELHTEKPTTSSQGTDDSFAAIGAGGGVAGVFGYGRDLQRWAETARGREEAESPGRHGDGLAFFPGPTVPLPSDGDRAAQMPEFNEETRVTWNDYSFLDREQRQGAAARGYGLLVEKMKKKDGGGRQTATGTRSGRQDDLRPSVSESDALEAVDARARESSDSTSRLPEIVTYNGQAARAPFLHHYRYLDQVSDGRRTGREGQDGAGYIPGWAYDGKPASNGISAADIPRPPARAARSLSAPLAPAPPVNPWVLTARDPRSTFALDVDTASYQQTRAHIARGVLPPAATVRMEEFVNYFDYCYPASAGNTFNLHAEAGPAPFAADAVLVKVGVKGRVLGRDQQRPAHLVFVIDTSGSMQRPDRLPVIRHGLARLLERLGPDDRISVVTYGTAAHLLLEATAVDERARVAAAIAALQAGGSTNLLDGLELGYRIAARHHRSGAINRVVLCSDGVANVGTVDADALAERVATYREQGIACTTIGVGRGAYDDALMERLANGGDGGYLFADGSAAGERVFADTFAAGLRTIAKDAKIQVVFDPRRVRRYRLIGYENRAVADEDFRNDRVDAGEVGSGQAATALYECELQPGADAIDLGTVAVRFHDVADGQVHELAYRLRHDLVRSTAIAARPHFHLAACAAEFAELLRGSAHAAGGDLTRLAAILDEVVAALPLDERAAELRDLVRRAPGLPRAAGE